MGYIEDQIDSLWPSLLWFWGSRASLSDDLGLPRLLMPKEAEGETFSPCFLDWERPQNEQSRALCGQIWPQPAHSSPPLLNLAMQASLPFAVSIIPTQFPFSSEH